MVARVRALGFAERHGADVPRGGACPAALLLAAPARRRRAPGRDERSSSASSHRSPAGCRVAIDGHPPRTSSMSSRGPRAVGSRPTGTPRLSAGARRPSRSSSSCGCIGDYERAKARQGVIDFDDMLTLTVELLETDERRRHRGPRAVFVVQRRRVPGHEPAPAAAARAVARRAARHLRGRRRGPDHLHVRRRHAGVPHRLLDASSGCARHRPDRQLPLDPPGAGPGEPPHRVDRPLEDAHRDPAAPAPSRRSRPTTMPRRSSTASFAALVP